MLPSQRIPYIKPHIDCDNYPRPQPIMQFKELEVDAVRYTAWQCSCALDRANRERMAARAASLAKTQANP